MSGRAGSDGDVFDFNDMAQPSNAQDRRGSAEGDADPTTGDATKPRQRVACQLCRKRKLKCDSARPSCSLCVKLGKDCHYDETRKKSGPKRGYVKQLEARLAQVEAMVNTQDGEESQPSQRDGNGHPNIAMRTRNGGPTNLLDEMQRLGDDNYNDSNQVPWEIMSMGVDEPLPTQDVIDELNRAYFDKIHPSAPMLHKPRYYAAMNLAPHMRPPICLRYAMWALAAATVDKYESLQEHFYNRARKYLQQDEMRGHGESTITVAHTQAWILIATFEFRMMFFPRAWMSSGRASRLALMMGLHRVDGFGFDSKQCLPPPKDETDKEERRRTFWLAFCVDRYASIGTGWPMTIEETDIRSNLPTTEEAYEYGKTTRAVRLEDTFTPEGVPHLNNLSSVVLMACLFGRNLLHLHRPTKDDREDDLNGEFWTRHGTLDNLLATITVNLPDNLRLPFANNNSNVVFANMSIQTATICLHQAAIYKAERAGLPSRIPTSSKVRCISAATQIADYMRNISHIDLTTMNPFISFCLYVSARVFVQFLKSRPKNTEVKQKLQFLLSAMHAMKRKNPLTESFLVQLDVDLEGAGLEDTSTLRTQFAHAHIDNTGCPYRKLADGANGRQHAVVFGDQGVAAYNNPNGSGSSSDEYTFSGNVLQAPSNTAQFDFLASGGNNTYDLASRPRSAMGSVKSSNYRGSSNGGILEMDTSPDASNGDQNTPGSSSLQNSASMTPGSSYTPPADLLHQQQQQQLHNGNFAIHSQNFYDLNSNNIAGNYSNIQSYANVMGNGDTEFDWDVNNMHTGFTPGPSTTGLTPGLIPGMSTGMTPGADFSASYVATNIMAGTESFGNSNDQWFAEVEAMIGNSTDWNTTIAMTHSQQMDDLMSSRKSVLDR